MYIKKNNDGVTLTILVTTIIVMLILFGITFSTGTYVLKNSQKNKMKTMLYMVQARAQILLDDYLFEHDKENESEENKSLEEIQDSDIGKELGGTYISNISEIKSVGYNVTDTSVPKKSEKIYCSWDETTLKSQGIDTDNLAQGDTIIIEYDLKKNEVNVASKKGIRIDEKDIHILKDF